MKKEIKIALVAIAAVAILYFGMNFMKGMNFMAEKNVYHARFSDISGLAVSNPIFANGYQVGIVKDIVFDYTGQSDIIVTFSLNDKMKLPKGSTAEIESDFMGNVKMNLVLAKAQQGTAGPTGILAQGDTIEGAQSEGLMARAAQLIPTIEQMLPKVDSILASVNALMADPALKASIHNVNRITADLTTSTRQLNTLMAGINRQMPTLMTKVDGVLDNSQQLTQNLSAIDVEATMQKVDKAIANVEAVTSKLNSNEGSLGLLMNDNTFYNRVNGTLQSAENLLSDVKEHPKRYINISVFGRKDK